MKKIKEIIFSLIATILILVFFIGGWELYVRLCVPKIMNGMTYYNFRQQDDLVNHSFIPNSKGIQGSKEYRVEYNINSFGCRDREYSLEKDKDTFRVLVVGDSFVEGHGVDIDDTFMKIVERDLNSEGKKVEIINGGVMSYSPILEYIWLKEKGLKLNPDMVVLLLDQSDIQDDYVYSKHAQFDRSGPKAVPATGILVKAHEEPKDAIKRYLKKNSAFYNFIKHKLRNVGKKVSKEEKQEEPLGSHIVFGDIETDRLFFLRENPKDFEIHWGRTSGYLMLISQMLAFQNIDYAIGVYPYGVQIGPDEWDARTSWGFEKGKVYPKSRYFDAVEELCKKHGIHFIDMFPALYKHKQENPDDQLFFKVDGHWTKLSQRLIAEQFKEFLLKNIK